jgi:malonyl-CoA O-methyltransferase
MRTLSAATAYHEWAPRYQAETAVSRLEDLTVESLHLPAERGRLLDVGCGPARRLVRAQSSLAVGVDLVPRMLELAPTAVPLVAADVRALPFRTAAFDAVWCRLMIGHVPELGLAYAELGRVCRRGATVLVTDFHPDAVAAGHRRTFTDESDRTREIEHYVHSPRAHEESARRGGLELVTRCDGHVSPPIRSFYEEAGRLDRYEQQRGLSLVIVFVFRVA